jgi:dCMP deaminase
MGIKKVIFLNSYAAYKGIGLDEGVEFLKKFGVIVARYDKSIMNKDDLI